MTDDRFEVLKKYDFSPCPSHGYKNIVYKDNQVICGLCGLVLEEESLDTRPEWRVFTPEQERSRSRMGMPTTYSVHDKGLSTTISRVARDAYGRELPYPTRRRMWRLRRWQKRTCVRNAKDRNLARAMGELNRLSDKLHIPFVVKERAAVIYRKALDKELVRGRPIDVMATAALYLACRLTKTPRSLNEVAEASLLEKKDVSRCYRVLLQGLDVRVPPSDPLIYVSKIAEKVGVSSYTQGLAIRMIQEAKSKGETVGKAPQGLVAAALYLACKVSGERRKQTEIAEAAGVTEVTLRNRYQTLRKRLKV